MTLLLETPETRADQPERIGEDGAAVSVIARITQRIPPRKECAMRLVAVAPGDVNPRGLLVAIGGDLDADSVVTIRQRLLLLAESGHDLALDLSGISSTDSTLEELLVACALTARPRLVRIASVSAPAAAALLGLQGRHPTGGEIDGCESSRSPRATHASNSGSPCWTTGRSDTVRAAS